MDIEDGVDLDCCQLQTLRVCFTLFAWNVGRCSCIARWNIFGLIRSLFRSISPELAPSISFPSTKPTFIVHFILYLVRNTRDASKICFELASAARVFVAFTIDRRFPGLRASRFERIADSRVHALTGNFPLRIWQILTMVWPENSLSFIEIYRYIDVLDLFVKR